MRKIILLGAIIISATTINAQTKVSSATFGAMEARWLGPGTMSGRITAIDGDTVQWLRAAFDAGEGGP